MNFRLVTTSRFERNVRRLRRARPDMTQWIDQILRDLAADPFQPHLRLHRLQGELSSTHAVSITYSHRIVLTLIVQEQEIVLLDIGTHNEVYR